MFRRSLIFVAWLASAAVVAQPADNDYRLGPGDHIVITVFGEEDLSMDLRLNDSGRLNYPLLGEIVVNGVTVAELEQLITLGLKDSYLLNPAVNVSIAEYRPFFVNGEVQRPGGIPFQPKLTIERAIALGGGFTERAARSKIEVIRANDPTQQPIRVKLTDPVYPGDIITVKQSFF